MLGWEQQSGFLGVGVLVGEENLNIKVESIYIGTKVWFNTKVHRFQSWHIRFTRILLVLRHKDE